ncbi:MAG TPA: hypothetical protein VMH81_05230 [Bryobacteraceae bacterium]|nr:hypothetical protein [Bryobacteraceae bacterium]
MASPPIPPSLEHLANRPFSFYPPIVNVEHNEWLFRKATWSEILVLNRKSGAEVWISRRFLGEVSRVDAPVLIVGLSRELEYRNGAVCPCQRRVIEMPIAVGDLTVSLASRRVRGAPAPVVGIRLESNHKRTLKLVGGALAGAILLYIAAVNLDRVSEFRQRTAGSGARDQQYLALSSRDDYLSVVQALGPPATDHWQSGPPARQFRALAYPDRKYTIVLMSIERRPATYIGTMDGNWKPIHSVELRSGGVSYALLRNLKPF